LERPDRRRRDNLSTKSLVASVREYPPERSGTGPYSLRVRTGVEVAVFVTRRSGSEVLILHRVAEHGGYWHVVAGGVESGETVAEAAERELREETGLLAKPAAGVEVVEYVYPLTEEPADRRNQCDPSATRRSPKSK
jgi:8-oxo-dGTP pyrophosphatase MutT (NUDIX family)